MYDRSCPVCERYSTMARIREAAGELVLVDAREESGVMRDITARGLDIDEGMVLVVGERMYYGADAIHALALMSTRSGVFNRLNHLLFQSQVLSRVLYPVLRACRNLLLKLLRRSRINNLDRPDNDRF